MSLTDLAASAEKVVEAVDAILPTVEAGAGFIPVAGPGIVLAGQIAHLMAPHIEAILLAVASGTGQPLGTVATKLIQQVTPGQANHAEFGPAAFGTSQ